MRYSAYLFGFGLAFILAGAQANANEQNTDSTSKLICVTFNEYSPYAEVTFMDGEISSILRARYTEKQGPIGKNSHEATSVWRKSNPPVLIGYRAGEFFFYEDPEQTLELPCFRPSFPDEVQS